MERMGRRRLPGASPLPQDLMGQWASTMPSCAPPSLVGRAGRKSVQWEGPEGRPFTPSTPKTVWSLLGSTHTHRSPHSETLGLHEAFSWILQKGYPQREG